MNRLTSKFSKFSQQLFGTFVFTSGGRILQLLLAALLSRSLGVQGYGLYIVIYAVAQVCQQPTSLGLPISSLKIITQHRNDNQISHLRGFLLFSKLTILGSSLVITIFLYLVCDLFDCSTLKKVDFFHFWSVLLGLSMLQLVKRQFSTLELTPEGSFWEVVFPFIVLNILVVSTNPESTNSVFALLSISLSSSVVISLLRLRSMFASVHPPAKLQFAPRVWLKQSLPFLLSFGARDMMNRVDVLILAPIAGLTQVGLYSAAFKMVYLISFPQNILNSVVSPLISKAHASGDELRLSKLIKAMFIVTVITIFPLSLALLVFSSTVIDTFYGANFQEASAILETLILAQLIAAFIAPIVVALNMTGYEKPIAKYNLIALAALTLFATILGYNYQADGVAWSRILAFGILSYLVTKLFFSQSKRSTT